MPNNKLIKVMWRVIFSALCAASYQVFKFDVQVLANGELSVGDGLVQVSVQIMKHLNEKKRRGSKFSAVF